jgi:hypothetical protein
MAISDGYVSNLETIIKAAEDGSLALLECTDMVTGKIIIAVCAINIEAGGNFSAVPLAKMFDGNPYEELNPPEVGDD